MTNIIRVRAGFYEGKHNGRSFTIEQHPDQNLDNKMMWFGIIHPNGFGDYIYCEPTWTKRDTQARIIATIDSGEI